MVVDESTFETSITKLNTKCLQIWYMCSSWLVKLDLDFIANLAVLFDCSDSCFILNFAAGNPLTLEGKKTNAYIHIATRLTTTHWEQSVKLKHRSEVADV